MVLMVISIGVIFSMRDVFGADFGLPKEPTRRRAPGSHTPSTARGLRGAEVTGIGDEGLLPTLSGLNSRRENRRPTAPSHLGAAVAAR
jgi:hypothetical protein